MASSITPLPYLANKHIVISGAGISGLSFPLSLFSQWPPSIPLSSFPHITIFERDTASSQLDPGRQGYSMSIRADGNRGGGVQALDDMGLFEKATSVAVIKQESMTAGKEGKEGGEGQGAMVFWEPIRVTKTGTAGQAEELIDWKPIIRLDGSKFKNRTKRNLDGMRIRRNALQKVLADAVADLGRRDGLDVKVEWGKGVAGIETNEVSTTKQKVTLSDGTNISCDLVIAADGSRSKIRNQLRPSDGLNFAETVILSGTAKFSSRSEVPDTLARDWGLCLGWNGIGCFVSPVDKTSVLWSISYRCPTEREPPPQPISAQDAAELLNEARQRGQYAGPRLLQLIDATDPSTLMVINCRDRPPFRHDLHKHGSVLWIGDANHAVSPFAGNGANMALIDSWELAKSLLATETLEAGVKAFEKEMVPRAGGVLKASRFNIAVAHAQGWRAWIYWAFAKVVALFMR